MNDERHWPAAARLGRVSAVRLALAFLVPASLLSPFAHAADRLQMYEAARDHDAKFQGSTYQRDAAEPHR